MKELSLRLIIGLFIVSSIPARSQEEKLYVGWAQADITPGRPVDLVGQGYKRISDSVHDPITATVLAIETRGEHGRKEQAIMISCDFVGIVSQTQKTLQDIISRRLNDFDARKLFMNATHTHTAPWTARYHDLSDVEGAMDASEYELFFLERTAEAVVKAWNERAPAGVSWGLGSALLGHNRRTVFFDGTAQIYRARLDEFSHFEGKDDHRVQLLFFWDKNLKLTGIVINVSCTAQVTGGAHFVSADYWHEVRTEIGKKYGKDLYIFPQVSAAGDITPFTKYDYIYDRAEQVMTDRKGISMRQEIANRTVKAVEEIMPYAKFDIKEMLEFKHEVTNIELPINEQAERIRAGCDKPVEIHVIRLGDVAIASNPFELYLDYGILIKKRSKAILTFVVELSCGHCGYVPTPRALEAGGYSAAGEQFGPEAGYRLVDETVYLMNDMWKQ